MVSNKALERARIAARNAIEALYYEAVCSIVEYESVRNENTKITRKEAVTKYSDLPCKLSFEKLDAVVQSDTAAAITQGAKLFIAPEIKVNGGSKIVVTWMGETHEYSCSGEPAVYPSHQEIMLELFKGWA